jgi:hypothetical protein
MTADSREIRGPAIMNALAIAVVCLTQAGCRTIIEKGDETIVCFNLTVRLCAVLLPLVGMGVCIYLIRNQIRRFEASVVLLVLIALEIAVVPGVWSDNLRITPEEISQTTGFWWAPTRHQLLISSMKEVRLGETTHGKTQVFPTWEVLHKDGRKEQLELSDLWSGGEDMLLKKLQEHGVQVIYSRKLLSPYREAVPQDANVDRQTNPPAAVYQNEKEKSCRDFVQSFYDWYVAKEQSDGDSEYALVSKYKSQEFSPEILRQLREDFEAQAKVTGELVGLDFDPFLGDQDRGDRYVVGKITRKSNSYWVEVYRIESGNQGPKPNVFAELILLKDARWLFVNFHYSEDADLLSILKSLREDRQRHTK